MSDKLTLLIVDDEQAILNSLYRSLKHQYDILLSLNGMSALEIIKEQKVAIILADQRMPEMNGVELFQKSLKYQPDTIRIMLTGYTDIEAIVDAVNLGKIFYYLHKPWEPEDLELLLKRAGENFLLNQENKQLTKKLELANQSLKNENRVLKTEIDRHYTFSNIIGSSPAMDKVFELMKNIIPTDTTVYIEGETGTGKELVARAIHANGPRKGFPFYAQNCGALPDTLLESELFGHTKGAFTHADANKTGLFEQAHKGTIFLDEMADTSPAFQQRLLRVLQEGEIKPLGSNKTKKVDVRIITSTRKNLLEAVRAGTFREDLYYRLNVFPIVLPPLRSHREDIPEIAHHFLEKFSLKMNKPGIRFTPEAIEKLTHGNFPGNVRELENLIERITVLSTPQGTITAEMLDISESEPQLITGINIRSESGEGLKEITNKVEHKIIEDTLALTSGNISKASKLLKISRLGLYKKIERLNIKP